RYFFPPRGEQGRPRRRRVASSLSDELFPRRVLQRVALSPGGGRRLLGVRSEAMAPGGPVRGDRRAHAGQRLSPGASARLVSLGGARSRATGGLGARRGEGSSSGSCRNSRVSGLSLDSLR